MPKRSRLAVALLLVSLPTLAAAQYWIPEEDPGPRGPHLAVFAGRFDPTGASLEGFSWGAGVAGRIGYRFGQSFGLELEIRRSASTFDDGFGSVEVQQTSFTPAFRIHGTLASLRTEGSVGLGWYKLRVKGGAPGSTPVEEVGQSRLGLLVSGAVVFPIAGSIDLLVDATYGGAYSTLFDYEPVWIAGWTLGGGVRVTFDAGATGTPAAR